MTGQTAGDWKHTPSKAAATSAGGAGLVRTMLGELCRAARDRDMAPAPSDVVHPVTGGA